ncbi:hypothetical protein FRACYDRAFT_185478 [Fragilariopsis cylindrus CCMP1102]|uniref:GRIP domain-containing protein n=1 Tax=Fragilariopsis cylindrus CCMP1102 TaxID=635003 RepID=A0A1E7FFN3_9STRA|nr:hypothetical protein FRACYDRAFT_185478 [Fragilariopsis cylindrus CCMP1102]|eukprot:OEU16981.1 hypothetical protein FRACYDRAFT_185478 [Fragilariopsis cylindrus CCMP1102]
MANNTSNNSNIRNGVNNSNNNNAAAAAAARGKGSVGRSATIASSPTSSGNTITAATATSAPPSKTSKAAAQMQKMREANNKYKNLLKMAKERIEQQEIDLKKMRETRLDEETTASKDSGSDNYNNNNSNYLDDAATNDDLNYWNLVRVSQRIRVDLEAHELNARGSNEEIWALIEWERDDTDRDMIDNNGQQQQQQQQQSSSNNNNRKKLWKRFDSGSELKDFIRRDTGEPLTLPPYSLTPQQSSRTTVEADKKVSSITEEYRRFRVKSEMTRKKMDAQVRELQSSNVETTKRQIEGREHVEQEMEATRRTEHNQLARMRTDAARQEDQWKEAYDILLKENDALKCSGSDAILASQWRQRYEACLKEKDDAVHKLQSVQKRDQSHQLQQSSSSERKYEMKYRDLKESFRLYRKKAKEIFVSQAAAAATSNIIGEEDSKLSYLKNLMVNYLTADPEVRDHMEKAIGTVLKFTPSDIAIIEKKKTDDASWGLF